MARIRVAHVAPIMCPVPVTGYGGIERVIEELLTVQVTRDVDVRLYASTDSTLDEHLCGVELRRTIPSLAESKRSGANHPVFDPNRPDDLAVELDRLLLRMNFRHYVAALDDAHDVDVVHVHGMWVLPFVRFARRPLIVSLYESTADPVVQYRLSLAGDTLLVANSPSTRDNMPDANWLGTVLEGLIPMRYPFIAEKEDYFVFVGRVDPIKGCHTAIRIAKDLGRRLIIIGPAVVSGTYFQRAILPHIDDDQIQYFGEMGAERLDIVARAAALLFPIEWEEPFGRIQAEAAACGTPVVAYARGAAPDVVVHGVTGYVAHTYAELLQGASQVQALDPAACRRHAESYLSMERVAHEYRGLYTQAIEQFDPERHAANAVAAVT
jgi:glycosyltransferase involved in cell wall biosynthesis